MKKIVNYLHELAVMKRRTVSGFDQFIQQSSNTLGNHAYRAAILGMILADMEGANPVKVGLMLLVHENGETRVGDPDFIASKYGVKNDEAEKKAFKDQIANLPEKIRKLFYSLYKEKENFETLESKVAWDADILEQILSAKELLDSGVEGAKLWLENKFVWHTKSGKKLFDEIRKGRSWEWLASINN